MDAVKMREMALVDWVKQAIFDAMRVWIDDHEDELAELITKSLSERIEIRFLPKLTVRSTEEQNEPEINGQQNIN